MPEFRETFIFSYTRWGWTETYYAAAANLAQLANLPANNYQRLVNLRSANTTLNAVRIAQVGGIRNGTVIPLNLKSTRTTSSNPDIPQATALVKCISSSGGSRSIMVRGLDDDDVKLNAAGDSVPSAYLLGQINTQMANFLQGGFDIRTLEGVTTRPWNQVGIFTTPNNDGTTLLTLALPWNPAPPARGDYVYFKYPRSKYPTLTGNYLVVSSGANTAFIQGTPFGLLTAPLLPFNVFVRSRVYVYNPITSVKFSRFVSRDTGRPIAQSRGRRRAVHAAR